MYKVKRVLFLIAETPLHPGSGSEVGVVDLPIQRERYTDFPKIESSSLKGCLREAFESSPQEIEIGNGIKAKVGDKDCINIVFGPEKEIAHAGAISITDARILLFPVKSLKGVFAWITCPFVLERFRKELELAGISGFNFPNLGSLKNTVPLQTNITITSSSQRVVLEEFTFEVEESETTSDIANCLSEYVFPKDQAYEFWKDKLKKDLVILSDDDFTQFVKTSTEIITRVRIDSKTGTVEEGALWTEEYLPQDTIFYSILMFTQPRVEKNEQKGIFSAETSREEAELIAEFFDKGCPAVIQVGGNQTIGKGFARLNTLKGGTR